jgi:5-formyltetrahydrofolate cyclo-ligase
MSRADPIREKAALRRRMRDLRDRIPLDDREAMAREIERRLSEVDALRRARTVLLFASFGSEVPTGGIMADLDRRGARVLLPFITDGGQMAAGEHRLGEPLVRSGYGPPEPEAGPGGRREADPEEIEAVVAPGLAFDRSGYRLGYGGGHFDRYLARLRTGAHRIGIGFHQQVVDRVPHGPGDERLDLVVTDHETFSSGGR